MRILTSFLAISALFGGCKDSGPSDSDSGAKDSGLIDPDAKDSGADTGDVEVDFIIDSATPRIGVKWANETQQKKYEALTQYSDEECLIKMADAARRYLLIPKAKQYRSAQDQKQIEYLKERPEYFKIHVNRLAIAYCSRLSSLRNTSSS